MPIEAIFIYQQCVDRCVVTEPPNAALLTTLLAATVSLGDIAHADALYGKILSMNSTDQYTYQRALQHYLNTCAYSREPEKAACAFQEAYESGGTRTPNLYRLSLLMKVYAWDEQDGKVLELFRYWVKLIDFQPTYGCVRTTISALMHSNHVITALAVWRDLQRLGFLSDLQKVARRHNELDLHNFNTMSAKVVILSHLLWLLERSTGQFPSKRIHLPHSGLGGGGENIKRQSPPFDGMSIITGWGLRSLQGVSMLKPAIQEMLINELYPPIDFFVPKSNPGLILISGKRLRKWNERVLRVGLVLPGNHKVPIESLQAWVKQNLQEKFFKDLARDYDRD
jgi:hypothetical protein